MGLIDPYGDVLRSAIRSSSVRPDAAANWTARPPGCGLAGYKVGHHGSLNATPKSLWKLFKNKSDNKRTPNRLLSLMSTMEGKHGSVYSQTEVPRDKLVHELARKSDLFTTQQLKGKDFFHDTVVKF